MVPSTSVSRRPALADTMAFVVAAEGMGGAGEIAWTSRPWQAQSAAAATVDHIKAFKRILGVKGRRREWSNCRAIGRSRDPAGKLYAPRQAAIVAAQLSAPVEGHGFNAHAPDGLALVGQRRYGATLAAMARSSSRDSGSSQNDAQASAGFRPGPTALSEP